MVGKFGTANGPSAGDRDQKVLTANRREFTRINNKNKDFLTTERTAAGAKIRISEQAQPEKLLWFEQVTIPKCAQLLLACAHRTPLWPGPARRGGCARGVLSVRKDRETSCKSELNYPHLRNGVNGVSPQFPKALWEQLVVVAIEL
jgi:hypothetical protein